MDLSLLQHLYKKNYFSIRESFNTWEEAIRSSVQPLIKSGVVKADYADSIIANVNKFGPYIVIAPYICIPHADDKDNVMETTLCFMKCNQPVSFSGTDYKAELFFVLASNDDKEHIRNMRKLVEFIDNEELVKILLNMHSEKEFRELLDC